MLDAFQTLPRRPQRLGALVLASLPVLAGVLPAQEIFSEEDYRKHSRRAAPRDAFPVLDDPEMAPADMADGELRADEPVLGIALDGAAKAYPIAVLGSHELVNDHVGKTPIAASW